MEHITEIIMGFVGLLVSVSSYLVSRALKNYDKKMEKFDSHGERIARIEGRMNGSKSDND